MRIDEELANGFEKALQLAKRLQEKLDGLEAENLRLKQSLREVQANAGAHRDRIDVLGADNSTLRRGVRRGLWLWNGDGSTPDDFFSGYVAMELSLFREVLRKLSRLQSVTDLVQQGLSATAPRSPRRALEDISRLLSGLREH
jgi:hypothetical protein